MCLAVPGRVLDTDGDTVNPMGRVDFGGVVRQISLAYVPEAVVGDYVVVHAGFAISVLDAQAAADTLAAVAQLEAAQGNNTPQGLVP